MSANLVWFEISSRNIDKSRAFYSGLFGWTYTDFGGGYQMVNDASPGGAIMTSERAHPLTYFATDDIDASVARVDELGGTATDVQEIPGVGRMAVCHDDQGATFGLYEPVQA